MEDDVVFDAKLKSYLFQKARRMAPADTWNLRLNAMKKKHVSHRYKFTIHYSGIDAHYTQYLQYSPYAGSSREIENKHRWFITRTVAELTRDLKRYFEKDGKGMRAERFRRNEYMPQKERRAMRHIESLNRSVGL
jgi:CRISPR/Cas system-associated endoribonuclease Cas2